MEGIAENAAINMPIQMMSLVDRSGRLTPLGFRFEDEEHMIRSVKVDQVISREKISLAGVREVRVVCRAAFGQARRLFELRYNIDNQQWRLFRFFD